MEYRVHDQLNLMEDFHLGIKFWTDRSEKKDFLSRSRYSASDSITTTHEEEKEIEKADSLRKLFADDELGSVLNFKEEKLKNTDSNNDSDTTSVILQRSRKYKKVAGIVGEFTCYDWVFRTNDHDPVGVRSIPLLGR